MADDSCKDQARENKFTGETLKNFMTSCEDLAAMVCDGQAFDQKLSDEAKDTSPKSASRTRLAASESVGFGRALGLSVRSRTDAKMPPLESEG
jgi:hypothetical protein